MLRPLHSAFGLLAAIVVTVVSVTGAILAFEPVRDELAAPALPAGSTIATLAAAIAKAVPDVEKIERLPSGAILVTSAGDADGRSVFDPRNASLSPEPRPSRTMVVVKNLHRKFLSGEAGSAVAGLSSLAVVLLALSGAFLLARRLGGWRGVLGPVRGTRSQRLHAGIARVALAGIVVSAVTGLVMSANTFELLPDTQQPALTSPDSRDGPSIDVGAIAALASRSATDLLALSFPSPSDPADAFRLTTTDGELALDRTTGAVLAEVRTGAWTTAYRFVFALHTGTLAWSLTLVLALSTAAIPVLAWTGVAIWWRRRRAGAWATVGAAPQAADTVILVGTEGNTTWGFAADLAASLERRGRRVHLAPMNGLAQRYRRADLLLVVTATYGDGTAPASASRFADRLGRFSPGPDVRTAVLGFGDRQFPRFCAFADTVEQALAARGLARICETGHVDRQSTQAYRDWCTRLGDALGMTLTSDYVPPRPATRRLVLRERKDYGMDVGAPVALLRFAPVQNDRGGRERLPAFEAGDLIGILPPDCTVARFYSLATSRQDGVLEICVRLRTDGRCSSYLHGLQPGDTVDGFIHANPVFRPASGSAPVILIGAGTGIAPLAGFIRRNVSHRPMHLYFGARHPGSDFLYEQDLATFLRDRRLTRLHAAFSRTAQGRYVHHSVAADAETVRALLARGGQVVVCGGREMGRAVAVVLASIIAPLGLTVADLQREGRYVEDVY